MRTTLLTLILLTHLIVLGQYPRQKVLLEKIKPDLNQLHRDKIDSIAYFMPYFVGDRKGITIDRNASKELIEKLQCEKTDVIYLLWQKNGKTHITKYNECWKYKTITTDTIEFLKLFASNFNLIKSSHIKPFTSINKNNDTLSYTIDHKGEWDILVEIKGKVYKNIIDCYNLQSNNIDGKSDNINAQYNNDLILIKLLDKLNTQLYSMTFDKE